MKHKTKAIAVSAMLAAITILFTTYLHFPMSVFGGQGYVHFGDAFIYLTASLLPAGFACAAAGISGLLSDLLSGAAVWAPASVIIKILIALLFSSSGRLICKRNVAALSGAWIITVAGYYIAEVIIYGNPIAPLYSQIGNTVQCAGSSILYFIVSAALDKINIKSKML